MRKPRNSKQSINDSPANGSDSHTGSAAWRSPDLLVSLALLLMLAGGAILVLWQGVNSLGA